MSDFIEFSFDDGSSVLLRTFPVHAEQKAENEGDAGGSALGGDRLPPGLGGAQPVGGRRERAAARVSALTHNALRLALRPLVPLLQEVHHTVASVPDRPDEVTVDFGVQFGSDLKLGIVGAGGQSSLTVSATWKLTRPGPAAVSTSIAAEAVSEAVSEPAPRAASGAPEGAAGAAAGPAAGAGAAPGVGAGG
ncbi:hypothetical protein OH807_02235 [Kitasatospora sp. NBC_01560]|uniref:CU044_2847 family protein n=1 Tax=Kitasatospora sp. NBC_01560 TaxID=2975965 RepID=UPI0038702840